MPVKPHAAKPRRPCAATALATLGFVFSMAAFATEPLTDTPALVDAPRRAELVTLVRQDCGSCHGLTLKGGLGPALLPETLQEKPEVYLKAIILHGLPGTAMPPWKRFLSEADAQWIVLNLQKGFPHGH